MWTHYARPDNFIDDGVVMRRRSGTNPVLSHMLGMRQPNGRPFLPAKEAELYPHVAKLATALAKTGGAAVLLREFVGPYGVADFLLLQVDSDALRQRWHLKAPPLLSRQDAALAAAASPSRPRTGRAIMNSVGASDSAMVRIRALERAGVLVKQRSGAYCRAPGLAPIGRTIALEAKLRDWRRGLDQARTYALWADRAVVILERRTSNWEAVALSFRTAGIGLAAMDHLDVPARAKRHDFARRLWSSEHVLAGLFGTSWHPET